MNVLLVLLAGALLLSFGAPIVQGWLAIRALRKIRWLTPQESPVHRQTSLSVILPARDEAADLRASVESLLRQRAATTSGGVELEVIIVDDHSTDGTAEIADALAREDSRVQVIHRPTLEEAWLGKANAMQSGLALAKGEYILISDADIVHDERALGTSLADMERRATDFLSFFPRVECVSLWENAMVPLINTGLGEFPKYPALAVGAFMLVKADVLRGEGGFEPIRQAPLDDVALACHLSDRGHATDFCFAPELVSVRLFKGNLDAFWGSTKSVLVHFEGRLWLAGPAVALSFAMYWTPPLTVLLGIGLKLPALSVLGLAAYALQYWSHLVSRRTVSTNKFKLLFFPVVPISIAACVIRALHGQLTEGAILWRGRRSPVPRASGGAGARGLRDGS